MELVEIKYREGDNKHERMIAGADSQRLSDYYEKLGANHLGRFE